MVNRAELPSDEGARPRRHRALERRDHHYDGSTALYTIALGIFVFLLIGALSLRQISSEGEARKVVSRVVATSTEVDLLLRDHAGEMRDAALGGVQQLKLAGYPLDVELTREEVLSLDDAGLRRLILDRSAGLLYKDGLGAFDQDGERSISTFSGTGLLDFAVDATSESMHERATIASVVLALLTLLAAAGVLLRNEGYARMRSLGVAMLVGGGAGLALAVGAYFIAGSTWSGDPYSDDIRETMRTLVDVGLRNYAAVTALGLAVALSSLVFRRLAARAATPEAPAPPAAIIGRHGYDDPEIDAGEGQY